MRILLATRNADKAREIRQILAPIPDLQLVTLDQAGIPRTPDEDAIEVHNTFHETALAKAAYFARRADGPTLADDSGLAVDALHGAPGVRSKRFSGRTDLSGTALDDANNQLLLERLRDVPDPQRTAHYVCAVALAAPDATPLVSIGTCAGTITRTPRGTAGFGYDPLFLFPTLGVTFAEMTADEKNRRSHRARALRALAARLAQHPARG
ncbi:MAG TPA: RdgB/HAM1 family non-canonical purine NTP pyrophosphatase [Longimicrobiales bacterium]